MIRRVCENCMKDYDVEKNDETPFPSFTVLGGVMGGIAGIFMGPLLLIPAGLIAGLATDVARCQICGSDKDIHELMEPKKDKWGLKTYIRVPFRLYENVEPLDDQTFLEETQKEYVYDEQEGQLTLVQNADDAPNSLEANPLSLDFQVDYESSFNVADDSFEAGELGPDMGDFGDSGSESGSGGNSGGGASDGGTGGGE